MRKGIVIPALYLFYLAILFMLLDLAVGIILIKNKNIILGSPLPPYGAVITTKQKEVFENLDKLDSSSYIVYDQELGWTVGPDRSGENGMYVSNLHGIRAKRVYTYKIQEGNIRIAAFGDSFTDCVGVKNEQSWPYLLEQSSPKLEVLNFGVRAYGTDQSLLRYRSDGKAFKPNIVLIGFMLENIRRNVNRYRPTYEHNTGSLGVKPRFIITERGLELLPNPIPSQQELKKLIIDGKLFEILGPRDYWYKKYRLAFNQASILFRSNILKIAWLLYEKFERNEKELYKQIDEEPFIITSRLLKTFYEEAIEDGVQNVIVIIFPGEKHLEYFLDNGRKYWQPLLTFLKRNDIAYIDLTVALANASGENSVITGHYNSFGNEVVSSILADWVNDILQ